MTTVPTAHRTACRKVSRHGPLSAACASAAFGSSRRIDQRSDRTRRIVPIVVPTRNAIPMYSGTTR